MTRVLLADDHPMIRTALAVMLRDTDYEIVGVAASGEEALGEIARLGPDILLLDLQMPGGTGMDVLRTIRAEKMQLRVILLTAAIDDSSLLEANALGVQGIVLKNSDPAYLLDCLDRVRHGRTWTDPELAERTKFLARGQPAARRSVPRTARTATHRLCPKGPAQPRNCGGAWRDRGYRQSLSSRDVRQAGDQQPYRTRDQGR